VKLTPKRSLSIQYVLPDNTPVDGMIVYVMRDIDLVGRGITNEDGFVTVYLKDEIYAEETLTVYMADPNEMLEENVMEIEAPSEHSDIVITLNEEISGGWFKKIGGVFKKVGGVLKKVVSIPGKVFKTIITKIPGLSKALSTVMKFTGISKVFYVLGKIPVIG
jgi:hypothetical protein